MRRPARGNPDARRAAVERAGADIGPRCDGQGGGTGKRGAPLSARRSRYTTPPRFHHHDGVCNAPQVRNLP
nr:MAG TPA: hypothetical protein [Caudoviricetes sp.]